MKQLIFIFSIVFLIAKFSLSQGKQDMFPYHYISQWEKGMEFMAVKNESGSLTKVIQEYKRNGKGKKIFLSDFEGEIFTFLRHEEREVKCAKGKCKNVISVFSFQEKEYEVQKHPCSLQDFNSNKYLFYVDNFLFYEDYKKANDLFKGEAFYLVKKLTWFYDGELNESVVFNKIEPNKMNAPAKIYFTFKKSGKEYDINLGLSRTNSKKKCSALTNIICNFDDYFLTERIFLNKLEQERIEREVKLENERKLEEEKKEKEKKRLEEEKKKNEAQRKAEEERLNARLVKLEEDKIKILEELELEKKKIWTDLKTKCHFTTNEIDEFTGKTKIITKPYSIVSISDGIDELNIQLRRVGNQKLIFFYSYKDLGCVSSYNNNKSYVNVKLEDNLIIKFPHIGDIDCGHFVLKAQLNQSDISKLKKSPIKIVRLEGTDYYHDVKEIEWKDFFIDKLNCIQ